MPYSQWTLPWCWAPGPQLQHNAASEIPLASSCCCHQTCPKPGRPHGKCSQLGSGECATRPKNDITHRFNIEKNKSNPSCVYSSVRVIVSPAWARLSRVECDHTGSRAASCPHTTPGCEGLDWRESGSHWGQILEGPSAWVNMAVMSSNALALSNTAPQKGPSCAACEGHSAACSDLKESRRI